MKFNTVVAIVALISWFSLFTSKHFVLLLIGLMAFNYLAHVLLFSGFYRYKVWKNWGEYLVFDKRAGETSYYYPCHQEAVDWLISRGFQKSFLFGGYMVDRDHWIEVHKGLRDDVGCCMSTAIRLKL